ncbi:MAG: hypothetical protein C0448_13090 [Sphingobacteriaceae bacterium]|nr:hypothetical protein [Sphingobacteriaceae bacterium]
MKHLIFFLLSALLISCSEDKHSYSEKKHESTIVQAAAAESSEVIEFTKYPTVIQMLNESHDFTEEDGSLKLLSKEEKNIHIQVSKLIFDGDQEKIIKEQTMRDIVYVAFQAFAQTDINSLTISSVPMKDKGNYINKYKLTLTISRENAKSILKEYLNTEDFKILFKLEGTIWIPSENFNVLMFKNLNEVFSELKS